MSRLPFQNTDPAHTSFQFLEDLSTAYWFSEVLFGAIELGLFDCIQQKYPTTIELAALSSCKADELARMLTALERMELVMQVEGRWCNAQITALYLTRQSDSYMGHFLLYRRYMQPCWQTLCRKVSQENHDRTAFLSAEQDDDRRTFNYVLATDQLLVRKAKEITGILNPAAWQPPLLDVGGGAGALCRDLLKSQVEYSGPESTPEFHADLLELGEVLSAAGNIYTREADWHGINRIEGDFRHYTATRAYGLIVLSNFLHAYSPQEATELLHKAVSLLSPGGMILIHDYFPDRLGTSPAKGALYDLAMMLNTYNGRCHDSSEVISWLKKGAMAGNEIRDLETDSSVIVSKRNEADVPFFLPGSTKELSEWVSYARQEGFERGVILKSSQIITGPWVRKKCQYGCAHYGKGLQCPPKGMDNETTRKMIDSYSRGILVEGMPPGRAFHEKLLALEKRAFLSGYHKAFAFTAGHCTVCEKCLPDGPCRFPGQARPSMEGSGIDVYETALRAGLNLRPVQKKMQYVKYMGLLMLE